MLPFHEICTISLVPFSISNSTIDVCKIINGYVNEKIDLLLLLKILQIHKTYSRIFQDDQHNKYIFTK